ncbi:MAG: transcriptional regulator TbsP [Halobacteriales archaeon]
MMPTVVNKVLDDVLVEFIQGSTDPLTVIGPSETVIEHLVEVGTSVDDAPTVRLLAAKSTLKDAIGDFIVAGRAADLVADGVLSVRTTDSPPGNDLIVSEEDVSALIVAGDSAGAVSTDDEAFVEHTRGFYDDVWADADEFSLRTPPLSQVRNTLGDDLSSDVEADFDAVLSSLETARGNGDGLDKVTISLLVAAKNKELLYDISKWGEDIGIASKATFSRTKTNLEELGLLDTEKVPIDVGRPRLRLKFGDDRLEDANAEELASVAQSLIA